MNPAIDTALLVSLIILIIMIAAIIGWYGLRKGPSTPSFKFPASTERDDLTLIDGIGLTLRHRLNELGITSFKQIAEFTEQDIERVNEQLSFKGRIKREGWVAQASKLVEAGTRSTVSDGARQRGKKKTTAKKTATARKTAKKAARKTSKKTTQNASRKT